MIKYLLSAALLILLFLSGSVNSEEEVRANVSLSIQQTGDIWSGQQVTLNLDLKTTGYSFSDSHFNLPEVPGAFLMQTDTTTVKFSETVDGVNWQVIRYPLALYPQKPGEMEVPPITVRISTSAGFGSPEKPFNFETTPLRLSINSPPGVNDGDLVVTTSSFKLDYEWLPESGSAHTGDAFTLKVTRRASDVSAMLLPPLPAFGTDGIATYTQAPEVSDKSNRGDLTGERIDSIIWVIEKPGSYAIPGIRFQWWDPDKRELKEKIVPGLSLDILPAATETRTSGTDGSQEDPAEHYLWLVLVFVSVIVAIIIWRRFGRDVPGQPMDTEKALFASLLEACRSNSAANSYASLHIWIECLAPQLQTNVHSATLDHFAGVIDDTELTREMEKLQAAIISPTNAWRGDGLLSSVRRIRIKIRRQKIVQSKAGLAPLNP